MEVFIDYFKIATLIYIQTLYKPLSGICHHITWNNLASQCHSEKSPYLVIRNGSTIGFSCFPWGPKRGMWSRKGAKPHVYPQP